MLLEAKGSEGRERRTLKTKMALTLVTQTEDLSEKSDKRPSDDLRRALAAAIDRRNEADARAADAKAAVSKAQALCEDATKRVNEIKAAHDRAATELRTAYAQSHRRKREQVQHQHHAHPGNDPKHPHA